MTTSACRRWVAAFALTTVGLASQAASAQVGDALVVVAKRTVTTNGYADIAARCPAGYVALSGGISSGSAWTVTTLAPTFGNLALFQLADGVQAGAPDGWYASVDMLEGPSTIALAVSCAQLSGPVVTVVESGQAGYFSDVSATAECPANYRALGGGIDVARAVDRRQPAAEVHLDADRRRGETRERAAAYDGDRHGGLPSPARPARIRFATVPGTSPRRARPSGRCAGAGKRIRALAPLSAERAQPILS